MNSLRIFISSVQGEFAGERAALRDFIRADALIRRFLEVFLFEDVPASDGRHGRTGNQAGVQAGHARGQVGGQEGQAVLSAKEIAMLQACLDGAGPAETLSAAVGHSSRTGHFKRWLKPLLIGGFLDMTVPDRPTSPAQQYRLTDKGRAAVGPDGNRQARDQAEGQAEGQAGGQARGQAGGQEGQLHCRRKRSPCFKRVSMALLRLKR